MAGGGPRSGQGAERGESDTHAAPERPVTVTRGRSVHVRRMGHTTRLTHTGPLPHTERLARVGRVVRMVRDPWAVRVGRVVARAGALARDAGGRGRERGGGRGHLVAMSPGVAVVTGRPVAPAWAARGFGRVQPGRDRSTLLPAPTQRVIWYVCCA